MNNPVLPTPKRKHVVLEHENQIKLLGLTSNKINDIVKNDSSIEHISTYYSFITKKHITIIFYYE